MAAPVDELERVWRPMVVGRVGAGVLIAVGVLGMVDGFGVPLLALIGSEARVLRSSLTVVMVLGLLVVLAWRYGQIPPTLNYGEPDPQCDLDYVPGQARAYRPRLSLKTAAGFAGCNACVVLEGA